MSKKSTFTMDFKMFEPSLVAWAKENVSEAKGGLVSAFWNMIDDAKWKPPQAPFQLGDLHASAEIDKVIIGHTYIQVSGGFNIEYAAKQHEQEKSYDKPTTSVVRNPGPKFLESKMAEFGEDYIEIVVERMKRKLY